MNKTTRRRLLAALRIVVSAGLIAALLTRIDPRTLFDLWGGLSAPLLLLALGLQLAGVFISAAKWWLLLRARGHPVPYGWAVRAYLIGQFFSNFLPTMIGGDAIRVYQLKERIGDVGQALASVFVERLTGFLALTSIAWIALALSRRALLTSSQLFWGVVWCVLFATAAVGAAVAAPLLARFVVRLRLPNILNWRTRLQTIAQMVAGYAAYPRTLLLAIMLSFVYQLSWIAVNAAVARALHLAVPGSVVALMAPISDIIGLVPLFFNGLGAREGTYALLLTSLAGQTTAAAIALSFLVFVVRLVVSALGGVSYLLSGLQGRQAAVDTVAPSTGAPRADDAY